jgi:dsDNA-specific endonuclease/ATPase MutS2
MSRRHSAAGPDNTKRKGFDPEGEPVVLPIEDSIDLHHFHPSELLEVVDAYLDAVCERGFREVRLIHGRGKGVQRARVQKFLETDPRVNCFFDAPPGRGGWGATVVQLAPGEPPERADPNSAQ